jgi:biopolymer transport protein ExbB
MKQFKVKSSTLKKGFFCLFVPAMFFTKHLHAQLSGYTYGKTITIQGSRISGTVTNFPVLISVTDNSLRTVANGGRVRNTNGYDIVFTLPDCSTILPMQIEKYVETTGQFVAWVRLPSLVSASNQIIYMFYGKTGVAANPSSTTVWDANYMGVYHFNNSVNDGTSNTRNLTDNSTANLTASKIGEGRRLDNGPTFVVAASARHLQLPDNIFNAVTHFTFEGWVYVENVNTSWERIFDFGRNTNFNMFLTPSVATNGVKRFAITINGNGTEQQVSSGTTTGAGAWHHFAVTLNDTTNTAVLYYDGAANATNTGGITLDPSSLGANDRNYFGRSQYAADEGLYGNFDEFRISNTARSAGWITTSYNNQNSPSTFYTVSSEVTAGILCSVLPVTITSFEAVPAQDGSVTISWIGGQETAGDKYILERSANGSVSYYRIQQVGTNSTTIYTQTVTAKLDASLFNNSSFIASPNPARESINITFRENALPQNIRVELLSNMGIRINVQPDFNGNNISMKLPALANGVYFLNVYIKGEKHSRKLLIVQ